MDGFIYLFAAYTAVWIVLFLYLFNISRKQQKLHREIEALREQLETKETEDS